MNRLGSAERSTRQARSSVMGDPCERALQQKISALKRWRARKWFHDREQGDGFRDRLDEVPMQPR